MKLVVRESMLDLLVFRLNTVTGQPLTASTFHWSGPADPNQIGRDLEVEYHLGHYQLDSHGRGLGFGLAQVVGAGPDDGPLETREIIGAGTKRQLWDRLHALLAGLDIGRALGRNDVWGRQVSLGDLDRMLRAARERGADDNRSE